VKHDFSSQRQFLGDKSRFPELEGRCSEVVGVNTSGYIASRWIGSMYRLKKAF
jgi:hypothetical protein